jgi:hypothetical protein
MTTLFIAAGALMMALLASALLDPETSPATLRVSRR